jgi:3-deoxy-D-manno-octulosonic-acid transferase
MLFFYNIGIRFYYLFIRFAALFQPKAKRWVAGRKALFERLEEKIDSSKKTVWLHCASLGEFEQGRPLLEAFRQSNPELQLVLSFFSPSGYDIRKDYQVVDVVTYLPLDTKKKAERFVEIMQPDLAIFVKYELWYHHLNTLAKRQIPTYLVSATFRPNQWFFHPIIGKLGRKILFAFDHIFVQNKASASLLQTIDYQSSSVVGDTRIDRVLQIAATAERLPLIEDFVQNRPTLVVGSSWAADEQLLLDYIHQHPNDWRYLIAPHNVDAAHINALCEAIQLPAQRYTTYQSDQSAAVLVVDTIGLLSRIYQYGTIAYIGGGFGSGIHSTLEPAAFSLPILFGPNYHKFEEAVQLVDSGGAFVVKNATDLTHSIARLQEKSNYDDASTAVRNYLMAHQGATSKIMQFLQSRFDFL